MQVMPLQCDVVVPALYRKGWEMKEDGEEDQEDVAEPKVKGAAEQHSAEPDGAKQGSVEAEAKGDFPNCWCAVCICCSSDSH